MYLWVDGIHLKVRLEQEKLCLLVMLGVRADGRKELVALADGFAMASGGLTVANIHAACGLGNALGMLYNAQCDGTPLLLTAGQQDRRLLLEEPKRIGVALP